MKHTAHGASVPGSLARLVGAARDLMNRGGRQVERRRHPRAPAEVAGTMGDVAVWVADLTAVGAGLVAPRPVDLGAKVDLAVELPMMDGHVQTTRVWLTVTACRPDLQSEQGWRIGGTVQPESDLDRIALVEYCHLAAAWYRLGGDGRPPRPSRPTDSPQPVLARHG